MRKCLMQHHWVTGHGQLHCQLTDTVCQSHLHTRLLIHLLIYSPVHLQACTSALGWHRAMAAMGQSEQGILTQH